MHRDGARFRLDPRGILLKIAFAAGDVIRRLRPAIRTLPWQEYLGNVVRRLSPKPLRIALAFLTGVLLAGVLLGRHPFLAPGTRAPEVREVHRLLALRGLYRAPAGDLYTAATARAVRDFQRATGLPAHGLVGRATWEALHRPLPAPPEAGPVVASRGGVSDRDTVLLLAHLVAGEAADEPFPGKVAVAAVALNRTRHPAFPATVPGVIFQPDAFESVSNGQFYRPVTEEEVRAAELALQGWDPSGGALYFWNPERPVNPWIWSRPVVTQIGNHVFGR